MICNSVHVVFPERYTHGSGIYLQIKCIVHAHAWYRQVQYVYNLYWWKRTFVRKCVSRMDVVTYV